MDRKKKRTRRRKPPPPSRWEKIGPVFTGQADATCFKKGKLTVIVATSPRWHMSIAHPGRYPTWDEIREARYRFVPDEVTVCMVLPPKKQYVNCFHLHEHTDPIIERPPAVIIDRGP